MAKTTKNKPAVNPAPSPKRSFSKPNAPAVVPAAISAISADLSEVKEDQSKVATPGKEDQSKVATPGKEDQSKVTPQAKENQPKPQPFSVSPYKEVSVAALRPPFMAGRKK